MGRVSDAKQRLLDATGELMWRQSYGALTVDQICERAGVKKGSFYHFFDSKEALAADTLRAQWASGLPGLEAAFSPDRPPLERLRAFMEQAHETQRRLFERDGRVLGCPYFSVGSEVCGRVAGLATGVHAILEELRARFESAIRDARDQGTLSVDDPAAAACRVMAFYEGLMTQARIQNDPAVLEDLWPGTARLLGMAAAGTRRPLVLE